jgi:hypothetical protein
MRALQSKSIPGGRYGTMRDVEQTRRMSRRKQYALLNAGLIRAKKDGLHTLIDLQSVDDYQASLPDFDPTKSSSASPKAKTAEAR